ncbi:N-acetylmuramic acid 6-phosphate etherase [Tolypocladium paradoxum]|uniref:N-acetyl-D-glucosamine kinase n=1 Tax=Tolypocladium paradoxum TaxID=94208 RepID=A0A2S4KN62_9HYPO|nr:N-acetylmuramic acid 6-phosphate etherase [Tolypocladium paradoxum]
MPHSSTIGLDAATASISKAVQEATDSCKATRGRQFQAVEFSSAGLRSASPCFVDRRGPLGALEAASRPGLTGHHRHRPPARTVAASQDLDSVVVVVAGTGSVAMSYARDNGSWRRTHRAGGWGHLLGDDGGGYGIGREVLRRSLLASDLHRLRGSPLPPLPEAVFRHFPAQHPGDLLSTTVLALAAASDEDARRIVEGGTASLARLVALLVGSQGLAPARCALVLAGGLMQDARYRLGLVDAVEKGLGRFGLVEVVGQPAVDGARFLLGV